MNKIIYIITLFFLASCAGNRFTNDMPAVSSDKKSLSDAFMLYKQNKISANDFEIVQHKEGTSLKQFENGYSESRFFVTYWNSKACVEGYTVFENCSEQQCKYKFEWVEGVCE